MEAQIEKIRQDIKRYEEQRKHELDISVRGWITILVIACAATAALVQAANTLGWVGKVAP